MRKWLTCTAASIVLAITGCSSVISGQPHSASAGSGRIATSGPKSASPSDSGTSSDAVGQAQLETALLTAADVGHQFASTTYTKTDKPLLCAAAGTPSFRQQTSPKFDVGAELTHASPAAGYAEQIFAYQDASSARRALSIAKEGLNCVTGTVYADDGTAAPTTIGKPTDVSTALGVDSGYGWRLQTSDVVGEVFASALGPLVITLTFVSVPGADTSTLPTPPSIARAAIDKIKDS